MHRFIPILADQLGAKSLEVVTHHRARQFGTTKYGIGRTFRVILDLITVPLHAKVLCQSHETVWDDRYLDRDAGNGDPSSGDRHESRLGYRT